MLVRVNSFFSREASMCIEFLEHSEIHKAGYVNDFLLSPIRLLSETRCAGITIICLGAGTLPDPLLSPKKYRGVYLAVYRL